jgi:hypothetical protein
MIEINDKAIKTLEADLKAFAGKAFPFASRNALNRGAFQARSEWQSQIDDKLVQRNKFTRSSIRVETTRSLVVHQQAAVVGSVAPYMDETEFGGTKRAKGKKGVPIATSYAAGQGDAPARTRLPRRDNKLANIRLKRQRGVTAKSKLQENFLRVKLAAEAGDRFVYLDLRRGPAIFRVLGSKERPRIRMVHDLSRRSVVIPATPTLAPAVAATRRAMPTLYRAALTEQLQRGGLFRG